MLGWSIGCNQVSILAESGNRASQPCRPVPLRPLLNVCHRALPRQTPSTIGHLDLLEACRRFLCGGGTSSIRTAPCTDTKCRPGTARSTCPETISWAICKPMKNLRAAGPSAGSCRFGPPADSSGHSAQHAL